MKASFAEFVGVDGCPAGWVAVALTSEGQLGYKVLPTFDGVLGQHPHALILVDVPIGLREAGREERLCDREARRDVLGPQGLDGDDASGQGVEGPVDASHGALADDPQDLVTAEGALRRDRGQPSVETVADVDFEAQESDAGAPRGLARRPHHRADGSCLPLAIRQREAQVQDGPRGQRRLRFHQHASDADVAHHGQDGLAEPSLVLRRRGTMRSSSRLAFQRGGSTGPVSTRLAPACRSSSSGRPGCRDTTTIDDRRVPAFSRSRRSNARAAGASAPSTTTTLGTKARATSRAPPGVDTRARSIPSAQRIVRSRSVPRSAEPTIRALCIRMRQPRVDTLAMAGVDPEELKESFEKPLFGKMILVRPGRAAISASESRGWPPSPSAPRPSPWIYVRPGPLFRPPFVCTLRVIRITSPPRQGGASIPCRWSSALDAVRPEESR